MSLLFQRRVEVIVATVVAEDYKTVSTSTVSVKDLRVQFKITKDLEKHPNQGHFVISNLSEATRSAMQGMAAKVILKVGYDDGSPLAQIFIGDVRQEQHERGDTDWLSTIEAGDGERGYLYSRVATSFPGGTLLNTVVNHLGKAAGFTLPSGGLSVPDEQYVNGYVLSGRCSTELTKALKTSGYLWSVQDQQLQILPKDGAITTVKPYVLGPDTGLIGSPQFGSARKKKGPGRLKAKSLLLPGLVCGGLIQMNSKYHKGIHRILKLEHLGDTHGGEWYSELELEPI